MPSEHPSIYELRIRPGRSWVRLDWRALWEYRDLLLILVQRDFISRYKQTVLGPAWFILQPLLTTGIFTVLFGKVAKLPTDGIPPVLFYLCGMLGWTYFSNVFGATSTTFAANAGLLGKVYFPRLILPLAGALSNLLGLAIQVATFAAFWAWYKAGWHAPITIRWEAFALPLLIGQVALLSLGVGLWLAAFTVKYRDFTHLAGVILQLWMYATPIIYPLSMIPQRWRWLAELNPMTMPTEALRWMLLGQGTLTAGNIVLSLCTTALFVMSGLLLFQKVERTFVDSI